MKKDEILALLSGVVFLLLSLLIFYFLLIEEMWDVVEFDLLGLGSGIFMLGLSLWIIWDTVSRKPDEVQASTR